MKIKKFHQPIQPKFVNNPPIKLETLKIKNLKCPPLEKQLREVLRETLSAHARSGQIPSVDEAFRAAMEDVARGIQNQERFELLKRFVAYGSLIPTWDKKAKNTKNPLNDEELASCVDFVLGHMITKFQGKISELLASRPIHRQVKTLIGMGAVPGGSKLVFGGAIRCKPAGGLGMVEGPDALAFTRGPAKRLVVHLVAEIKSMRRSLRQLRKQTRGHLSAVKRGLWIRGNWFETQFDPKTVHRIYVIPSTWPPSKRFELTHDQRSVLSPIMEEPVPPWEADKVLPQGKNENLVYLRWSYDVLRAAAFQLAFNYIGLIGLAMAKDPRLTMRKDMPSFEAAKNDFIHQLHVAFARQYDVEPNPRRLRKTCELYNVLGWGWLLGHDYRNKKGKRAMMYGDDVRRLQKEFNKTT